MSLVRSIRNFTPTKGTLFWTTAGASVLTMVLGFTMGGWVTEGTAGKMAATAATETHIDLASRVCAANFAAAVTAQEQQKELLALASYKQRGYIQEQSWALMPGENSVPRQVADLCARKIAEMGPEALLAVEEASLILEAPVVNPG